MKEELSNLIDEYGEACALYDGYSELAQRHGGQWEKYADEWLEKRDDLRRKIDDLLERCDVVPK